jgi:hypothetical protein
LPSGKELEDFMSDNADHELALFTEALKLPLQDRAAFLENACAGDQELRQKVDALLKAHDRVGSFLEEPPTGDSSNE